MAPWAGTSSGTDHTGCGGEKPPKVTWATSFEARAIRVSTPLLGTLQYSLQELTSWNGRWTVYVIRNLVELCFVQFDSPMLQHGSNFAMRYTPTITRIFLSNERRREVSYENSYTVRVQTSYAAPRKVPRPAATRQYVDPNRCESR